MKTIKEKVLEKVLIGKPDTIKDKDFKFEMNYKEYKEDLEKTIFQTLKDVLKLIDELIHRIATNKSELALVGHKRACCMMTLKELKQKITGK